MGISFAIHATALSRRLHWGVLFTLQLHVKSHVLRTDQLCVCVCDMAISFSQLATFYQLKFEFSNCSVEPKASVLKINGLCACACVHVCMHAVVIWCTMCAYIYFQNNYCVCVCVCVCCVCVCVCVHKDAYIICYFNIQMRQTPETPL